MAAISGSRESDTISVRPIPGLKAIPESANTAAHRGLSVDEQYYAARSKLASPGPKKRTLLHRSPGEDEKRAEHCFELFLRPERRLLVRHIRMQFSFNPYEMIRFHAATPEHYGYAAENRQTCGAQDKGRFDSRDFLAVPEIAGGFPGGPHGSPRQCAPFRKG